MKNRISTRDLVQIALCSAIITICSWISLNISTVPFTLQTAGICLTAGLLGWKKGTISVIVYLLLGAIGLPVFAAFHSGFGTLLGMTGGYLWGFVLTSLIAGFAADRYGRTMPVMIIAMVLGTVACYITGTAWFIYVYAAQVGPIGVMGALSMCVFPYLIPDAAKVVLAALIVRRIHPHINKA